MQKKRAITSASAFLNSNFNIIVDITGIEIKENDWHLWQDMEGNSLRITKPGLVQVYPAKYPKQVTKDIFVKALPSIIADHSYWLLAIFAKNKSLLCFLGNDGLLRCSYFENKTWKMNISSLLLGYNVLSYTSSGYMENVTRRIRDIKVTYPKGLDIEEVWASGYPVTDKKLRERIQCHLINQD